MALSHLGTGKVIQSLTERSEEARSINTFYDVAYVATIRDFSIPSTKKFLTLQLVEENPTSEWRYSYRYPNECVLIKRILSGTRNDSRQTRVPFIESQDSSGKLILTDAVDAVIEAVTRPTSESFLPPDMALALSYRLAYYIAPRTTGGNAFTGLKKDMMDGYLNELAIARRNAANEIQPEEVPESEFIRGRE